jgi:hypothetical protein
MSAPYIIPFNFQPVSTVVGTTASYTVPSGKFAIIDVSISSTLRITNIEDDGGHSWTVSPSYMSVPAITSTHGHEVKQFRLKAGDVLSFANTSASSYNPASNSIAVQAIGLGLLSYQQCLINSVVVATAQSTCTISFTFTKTGTGNTITVTPTTNNISGYIASEYNAIS